MKDGCFKNPDDNIVGIVAPGWENPRLDANVKEGRRCVDVADGSVWGTAEADNVLRGGTIN